MSIFDTHIYTATAITPDYLLELGYEQSSDLFYRRKMQSNKKHWIKGEVIVRIYPDEISGMLRMPRTRYGGRMCSARLTTLLTPIDLFQLENTLQDYLNNY